MWIFESARLRLTIWVVVAVALVSLAFSGFIYKTFTDELENSFFHAELKVRTHPLPVPKVPILTILSDDLQKAKKDILLRLATINGVIVLTSGFAGYFLAGKALSPIEKALMEQKRFVSDASHELRTPLTSLMTEIEVALRDKKLTLKDARTLIKSNLEEVEKMKALTNYLLACARYGDGNAKLEMTKLQIKDVVEPAVKKITPMADLKKIEIKKHYTDFSFAGSRAALEELLVILLDNAVKYSNKKDVVEISTLKGNRSVVIVVKDKGMGIKSTELPYLFNRFYRADTSRSKSVVEGFGLGLSIAKGIVDAHSGSIRVNSKLGVGTTFTVTLPG